MLTGRLLTLTMPPRKPPTEDTPPAAPDAQQAADEAGAAAQQAAQSAAAEQGVTLSAQQLEQIGQAAAERTFSLFEKAGAFRQPEPPPPPPPPPDPAEQEPAQVDAPPSKPPSWAAKVIGEH